MARRYLDICRVLTGNVVRDENGVIYPAEKVRGIRINLDYMGSYNGAFRARFFGLSVRQQKFKIHGNQKAISDSCSKHLGVMGSAVRVSEPENAQCVLVWRYMLNPVLLAMQIKDKELTVTAFTARSVLGQIACFRVINKFYKPLEDVLDVMDGERMLDRDHEKTPGADKPAKKADKHRRQKRKKDSKDIQKNKKEMVRKASSSEDNKKVSEKPAAESSAVTETKTEQEKANNSIYEAEPEKINTQDKEELISDIDAVKSNDTTAEADESSKREKHFAKVTRIRSGKTAGKHNVTASPVTETEPENDSISTDEILREYAGTGDLQDEEITELRESAASDIIDESAKGKLTVRRAAKHSHSAFKGRHSK